MILQAADLVVRYRGSAVAALDRVSCAVAAGELVAVGGPNGSGKTSLVRALTGLLAPAAGTVQVRGRPVAAWGHAELARVMAVVPQREEIAFPLRVHEAVMLGRYARLGPLGSPGTADLAAVASALARCDAAGLAERSTDTLSGGEWQRVRLARALAQEPAVLVLDEPTASLDVRHEMEILELIHQLVRQGLAGLVVTHQLNLAARFADRMVLLDHGRVAAEGRPVEVLRQDILSRVFGWPVAITWWQDGSPQVIPLRAGEVGP
ncbi:MAG TPA: ABC transporter ATP-binding protein [Gemmatimonadales bacterium]|nr:ABC transporter ATP-binding protein [Gemmatimonadales bacterium]